MPKTYIEFLINGKVKGIIAGFLSQMNHLIDLNINIVGTLNNAVSKN